MLTFGNWNCACSSKSNVSRGNASQFYLQLNKTATKRMLFFYISSTLLGPLVINFFLHIATFLFLRDYLVIKTHFWLKENIYNLKRRQRQ